jgi:putative NADPH-quinone reductase
MRILQIIAHPNEVSFTKSLASQFAVGAESAGHNVYITNVFDEPARGIKAWEDLIEQADHLNFAWPCHWEMPPAKLVDFLQTVFVRGFAFESQGDRMVPRLNLPVTCLISMGQEKTLSTTNLSEAMKYCGLHPEFLIFNNVGPRLTSERATAYLELAYRAGAEAKGKQCK